MMAMVLGRARPAALRHGGDGGDGGGGSLAPPAAAAAAHGSYGMRVHSGGGE